MNARKKLLDSIAQTIQDYRDGILPQPITDHVERWIQQFDTDVQVPILEEVNNILQKTYLSKQHVMEFLCNLVKTERLVGRNASEFWRSSNFLDIQGGGNSQKDILALFSSVLKKELGFGVEECGKRNDIFIYLDDGIFTGNRVRYDLEAWIRNDAPPRAKVHVVCLILHRGGAYYAEQKIKEASRAVGKQIDIIWWRCIELEDRRAYSYKADILWPTYIPDDPLIKNYVASLNYPPVLRAPGNPGRFFSSDQAKILLEQEFLKAGVRIRQMCPNLTVYHRPLGYMKLEALGFGSLIVTYRNCPNNAPLVFWAGDPWYPLFPRIANTRAAIDLNWDNFL